jgi:hypothetical protein
MKQPNLTFDKPLKQLFYTVFSLLFFTGLIWILCRLISSDSPSLLNWMLKLHGALAMMALILLGWVIPQHIQKGWKKGKNKASGIILIFSMCILILTGYGLYYWGNETLRNMAEWVHSSWGLILPIFIIIHIVLGRKKQKK